MDMRPCVCGEADFHKVTTAADVDGIRVERFRGYCRGCGRRREFNFEMPDETEDEPSDTTGEIRFGHGREPSRLIDPGEWLGMAELFDGVARDRLATGSLHDEEELSRTYYLLVSAAAAVEEAIKFLPVSGDAVPEGAFRSQRGRQVYEARPERFRRHRLLEERAARQELIVAFDAQYGSDPIPEAEDG
jgi:hypothetical protein